MDFLRLTTTRRKVLAASIVGLGSVGVLEWAGWALTHRKEGGEAPAVPAPAQESGPFPDAARLSFLQIVAHPDDDLYFVNPGLQQAIARGCKLATVIVTAGEGDGINVDTDDPGRTAAPVDYAGYSAARHNGHRAAYARMATGSADAAWKSEALALDGGLVAEHCTLPDRPDLHLYFLNIRKQEDPYRGVLELWSGAAETMNTLPVPGSPVRDVQAVSRDQVVAALSDLLARHRPHVVRTLDPDPEHDPGLPGIESSDHRDHTAVALFSLRAVARYRDATGAAPAVDHYRGYANRFWPYDLSEQDVAAKADLVDTYAGTDGRPCPEQNCGDYQLGPDPLRSTHIYSTKLRHEPTTDWLVRDADGRLAAFAVLAGRVVGWRERTAGRGDWTGPEPVDEGRGRGWMLPVVSALRGPDGRLHLVGLRRTEDAAGDAVLDVVHAVRERGAESFGAWESVGNPDAAGRQEQREIGVPAAAVDGEGRLHVLVRNFAQSLSLRVRGADGSWGEWAELGGTTVQDGPSAYTGRDGLVRVFVPDKHSTRSWTQQGPGGAFGSSSAVPTGQVASGRVTALEDAQGSALLVYREARTALVQVQRRSGPTGKWPKEPVQVGGGDGIGPVAAVWVGGNATDALLARLGTDLSLYTLTRNAAGVQVPWVRPSDLVVLRSAALALGPEGVPVAAVLGADGHPRVASYDAVAGAFGAWKAL
ncbi:PIG-L family deacetylase [Kitasatospora phosalacinea]|uniref:PIG-L family deacetylase n=1 Tax=Kitasatospora phosalacinea TaxID=2065 RepID=A0ABW6GR04_9ACTN